MVRVANDLIGLFDFHNRKRTMVRVANELVGLIEFQNRIRGIVRVANDLIGLTEIQNRILAVFLGFPLHFVDAITLTHESIGKTLKRFINASTTDKGSEAN